MKIVEFRAWVKSVVADIGRVSDEARDNRIAQLLYMAYGHGQRSETSGGPRVVSPNVNPVTE